jgi:hypothetical protein
MGLQVHRRALFPHWRRLRARRRVESLWHGIGGPEYSLRVSVSGCVGRGGHARRGVGLVEGARGESGRRGRRRQIMFDLWRRLLGVRVTGGFRMHIAGVTSGGSLSRRLRGRLRLGLGFAIGCRTRRRFRVCGWQQRQEGHVQPSASRRGRGVLHRRRCFGWRRRMRTRLGKHVPGGGKSMW